MARSGCSLTLVALSLAVVAGCLQANPDYEAERPAPKADAPGIAPTPDLGGPPVLDLGTPVRCFSLRGAVICERVP